MSIEALFDELITIRRADTISGYRKIYNATVSTSVQGAIQALSDVKTAQIGGALGQTYKGWVGIEKDIREGDKIQTGKGNVFKVISVVPKSYDYAVNQHKELILEKIEDSNEN